MRSCNIALTEESHFVLCKSTDNAVQNSAVVEKDEIAFLPVVCIDVLWCNGWSLNIMYNLANLGEVDGLRRFMHMAYDTVEELATT